MDARTVHSCTPFGRTCGLPRVGSLLKRSIVVDAMRSAGVMSSCSKVEATVIAVAVEEEK